MSASRRHCRASPRRLRSLRSLRCSPGVLGQLSRERNRPYHCAMGGGTGRRRILIAGGTLLALLAAVGLASRAHTPAAGGGTRALDADILLEYALVLTVALAVVVVPAGIWMFVTGRKEESGLPAVRRNWIPAVFLTMCGFAIVSALLLGKDLFRNHHPKAASRVNPIVKVADRAAHSPRAIRFD